MIQDDIDLPPHKRRYQQLQMTPEQKVLMKAAKLIERHGWVQGFYGNKSSGYCMVGAILSAKDGKALSDNPMHVLRNFLGKNNIIAVNDRIYTDSTQAICALTGAAMMEICK